MICIIALAVFSILGIFSAAHRALAKEAFDCVLRRVTLRPCNTGFNEKTKGRIIGKILNRSVRLARFFNKRFELISWLFMILTLASAIFIIRGGYNYYMYGSCNGLNQNGFCVFDPTGGNNKISALKSNICSTNSPSEKQLTMEWLNLSDFPQKLFGSENKIIFIGCYNCDYSRKAYPLIKELVEKKRADFTFIHIPVKEETNYLTAYAYCAYKQDKEKFWNLNDRLFASDKQNVASNNYAEKLAEDSGYDIAKLQECVLNKDTGDAVIKQIEQAQTTGIYGTPTIFINGKALVGPKPYRVYERMLKN